MFIFHALHMKVTENEEAFFDISLPMPDENLVC